MKIGWLMAQVIKYLQIFLESIISIKTSVANKISFPTWLGNSQKVIFLHDGTYVKDVMEWDLDNFTWRVSQHCGNGTEIFGITLPNFCQSFQTHIDDGTLIPGWNGGGGEGTFTLLESLVTSQLQH
jgi:hypothetical protein